MNRISTFFLFSVVVLSLTQGCATLNTSKSEKCLEGNCQEGHGVMVYPDGSRYDGEFLIGKKHGQGTYTLKNGASSQGEWKYDKMVGEATITFPDGARYTGSVVDGKPSGRGVLHETDGTRIEGQFLAGRFIPENEIPPPENFVAPAPTSAPEPLDTEKADMMAAKAPVAAKASPRKTAGRKLDNLPDYCRKVAEANNGSYQVEEACLQMAKREDENLSRTTIMHMNIPPRIHQYCQTIADANAGSFVAMFSCMQKELAAMERLK